MNACCNALAALLCVKQSQRFGSFLNCFHRLCYWFRFCSDTAVLLDEQLVLKRIVLNKCYTAFAAAVS